ncbi:MAG: 6-phosphogluconolactonase [Blastocatellia bacterium]|nr:6-phosphogluconolactonase [Blastocatellia bacterium]
MSTPGRSNIIRRVVGDNVWLGRAVSEGRELLARLSSRRLDFEVLETEDDVGRAMLEEIEEAARSKAGDLVIILLGGRGAQALHRLLGEAARADGMDDLLGRLHVFTQDALAPMRRDNGLSFVRDFERLLGERFFEKVKSFTPMRTDADDLEGELARYVEKMDSLGGIDIFFLGLGPEPGAASHLAYIKPGSGATASDMAGVIPISSTILEHHITKFKAGGSAVEHADETECRRARKILTLGPAAILSAKRIVQSIVDARTAPAKRESFGRVLETEISEDPDGRAAQLDENPGLWVRLHPNVRSLILPDVLEA